ncbi:helix-turn-helix domain-containing protein [Halovenus sp. HT40]|uniref:helix-turn-helix domain-containing protein n=1 Tax=Halovenus sp. HT40 TaxID=3126691 RepID=UPI00300F3868
MEYDGDEQRAHSTAELKETFATIGNETRAEILRILGQQPHTERSFSELRAELDEQIDSGQFNYHLQQLLGQFVSEGEDGYTLRPEGVILYRLIRTGSFTQELHLDPFDTGFECHFCGTVVQARYETGVLEMECPGCESPYGRARLPPSAIDPAEPESALTLIDQYLRQEILALSNRVCPFCVNELDTTFLPGDEVWTDGASNLDLFVEYRCDHCGNRHYLTVGLSLLYNSSLIAFFEDHGVDITTVHQWELEFAMTDRAITVEDTDPWEVTLRVTQDNDTCVLTVDEDLTVLDAHREVSS